MSKRQISIVMLQRTIKARTAAIISAVYKTVQKPAPFMGIEKEYTPRAEDGLKLPSESQQVQLVAVQLLESAATDLTTYWDITATRDAGNQVAVADIKVRGSILATGVSLSTLLFLEKELINVRTLISAMPTLDGAKEWTTDGIGISRARPVETVRTEKVEVTDVVVQATDKFPAQVRDRVRDQIVGTWSTTHFSGALSVAEQHRLVGRVNELIEAIKLAREEANTVFVDEVRVGDALFGFLFDR